MADLGVLLFWETPILNPEQDTARKHWDGSASSARPLRIPSPLVKVATLTAALPCFLSSTSENILKHTKTHSSTLSLNCCSALNHAQVAIGRGLHQRGIGIENPSNTLTHWMPVAPPWSRGGWWGPHHWNVCFGNVKRGLWDLRYFLIKTLGRRLETRLSLIMGQHVFALGQPGMPASALVMLMVCTNRADYID